MVVESALLQTRKLGVVTLIIAMTANAFDEDRRRCMDAGMVDFITKPVRNEILRETVARWMAR